jgi:hypothetical protein
LGKTGRDRLGNDFLIDSNRTKITAKIASKRKLLHHQVNRCWNKETDNRMGRKSLSAIHIRD